MMLDMVAFAAGLSQDAAGGQQEGRESGAS